MKWKGKKVRIFPERFGFFPYMFLVYVSLPAFAIAVESGLKLVIGYGLLLLFLLTYRQLYCSEGKKPFTYWLVVQMLIILVMSLFYSPNNLFMGFFPANFIGWYKKKRSFYLALAAFAVMQTVPLVLGILNQGFNDIVYFLPFFVIMLMSPFGIRSMNKRQELEKQLSQANEQIKNLVKREERMRIARDLHDTLGHTLSLITLKSQLVEKLVAKQPDRARTEAKEIEKTSRTALKQVRDLVSDMRAVTVAEELVKVQSILEAAGIEYQFNGDSGLDEVPYLSQNILSLCIKEGVTNVVKHSKGKNCTIHINQDPGEVVLMIKDDGVGLDERKKDGNGLKGMAERLALIEGKLNAYSNKGTELIITIPVVVKQKKDEAALL
ncbi:sensor histidine kinase [Fictibacillus enclensis]|uniref:sensor histidine kinase n=1 Tax=Fictibacillus enclensis TaxID=1017270 RepID=UPI0024BF7890|nr:sensor histidine kinase [Fictibacillus enclensis]WHY73920.1 sensor histidine kinase [Fictibacillus enclensis]